MWWRPFLLLNTGLTYWIDNGYLPAPGTFVPINILTKLKANDFTRVVSTATSSTLTKSGNNFVLQATYPEGISKNGTWESGYLPIGKATTLEYAVSQTLSNPTGCGIRFYLVEEGAGVAERIKVISAANDAGSINLNLNSTKKYKLRLEQESRNGTTTTTITKLIFS